MSSPNPPPSCAAHPSIRAAWQCEPCGRALCEDCAALLAAGRGTLEGSGARWLLPWSVAGFASQLAPDLGPLRLAASGVVLPMIASSTIEPFDVRGGDLGLGTHIVQAALLRLALTVALSVLASLAGRLVFTRAGELGHGDPESHRVPVAPDAVPRGRR